MSIMKMDKRNSDYVTPSGLRHTLLHPEELGMRVSTYYGCSWHAMCFVVHFHLWRSRISSTFFTDSRDNLLFVGIIGIISAQIPDRDVAIWPPVREAASYIAVMEAMFT